MKFLIFVLFIFCKFLLAMDISELEWSKRLLIISAKSHDDKILINSNKFLRESKCQIEDRNIQIIIFEEFKNKEFIAPEFIRDQYGIWLVGYDGFIKDYSNDESVLFRLFDLIDSMPMRQNEIKDDIC